MKKFFITTIIALLLISTNVLSRVKCNNPIPAGFYPGPGICRVGNDYYITTSTFAYFRGLPVFHSADLVHWKQIGDAMNRTEQLIKAMQVFQAVCLHQPSIVITALTVLLAHCSKAITNKALYDWFE
jgi:hypothetical protein